MITFRTQIKKQKRATATRITATNPIVRQCASVWWLKHEILIWLDLLSCITINVELPASQPLGFVQPRNVCCAVNYIKWYGLCCVCFSAVIQSPSLNASETNGLCVLVYALCSIDIKRESLLVGNKNNCDANIHLRDNATHNIDIE